MDAVDLLGVADHPALELLNSATDATGPHLDVVTDGEGLLVWLVATGLCSDDEAQAAREAFPPPELDVAAAEARGFRERMRAAVAVWAEPGGILPATASQDINDLLARDQRHLILLHEPSGHRVADAHRWTSARAMLALPAAAFADLAATGQPALIRRCEGLGCTMWFYDRTRNHQRRWCRMAVCGNRAKARAHRARAAADRPPSPER